MARLWLIGCTLLSLTLVDAAAYDLRQHQWNQRVLVLVAPASDDPELIAQRHWLAGRRAALADRDMLVIEVWADAGLAGDQPLSGVDAAGLRDRLQVAPGDRVQLLIGKDGGIKRRAALNTDLSESLGQIDAMPMRRQEIRAKQRAGLPVTPP
jgi:hypothetical protein